MSYSSISRTVDYAILAKEAYVYNKSKDKVAQQKAANHLAQRLGKLKGLPQKVGQLLSFSNDQSSAVASAFETLQEESEPLPFDQIAPRLEAAWQKPFSQALSWIDEHGQAASLGQVHRARLHSGAEVAIKVQYPGIRNAIRTDLNMLGWLSIPIGNLNRGFDLKSYRKLILDELEQELDYLKEAENQIEFSKTNSNNPQIIIPEVNQRLSTKEVLVSSYLTGDHWHEVKKNWSSTEKKQLGRTFVQWFFDSLFQEGSLHADLHPGNLRFVREKDTTKIVVYDFGSVYQPENKKKLLLLRLIQSTIHQSESPYPIFLGLGFSEEYLEPLKAKLPALCRVMFEPFCVDHPYDVRQWKISERISDILGNDRLNFRIAGPADLIFVLRAFHNLIHYLTGLEAKIPWKNLLLPIVQQNAAQLSNLQIPIVETKTGFESMAQHMKIRVKRQGKIKAEITTKAVAIDRIDQLLDEEIINKIRQQQHDLESIVQNVRRRGYTPGPVFNLQDQEKEVSVWLE